jgi:lysine 6-dehydrogenase
MKVAVLGAAGIQGFSTLIYLLEQRDITEVVAMDVLDDRLRERIGRLKDDRVRFQVVDVKNREHLLSALTEAKANVIANDAAVPGCYEQAARTALEAGAHYLDLGGPQEIPAQLALCDEFEKKGLTGILDMGSAPGMSNIMAAYCINMLDSTETIDFKWAGGVDIVSDEEHSVPISWGYNFKGIIGLFSGPTLVYEGGKLVELEPRSLPEKFTFKEPIGTIDLYGLTHGEPRMLSRSFPDIKRITFKLGYRPEFETKVRFLRDLGFGNQDTIDVKGQKVVPWDVLETLLGQLPPETKHLPDFRGEGHCFVRGTSAGQKVEYHIMFRESEELLNKYRNKGCQGLFRAGILIAIAAVMVGRGQVRAKGVFHPETSVPPDLYLAEVAKEGFEVQIEKKVSILMQD